MRFDVAAAVDSVGRSVGKGRRKDTGFLKDDFVVREASFVQMRAR